MRVSINAAERALALLSVDYGDKECEATRKSLARLHIEEMAVATLQGEVGVLRRGLKNTAEREYDWSFVERRALSICLRIYRDKLRALAASEEKLQVQTSSTDEKIGDIGDFLTRLAGQESFFREDEDDDRDPPPKKLSDEQVREVRDAAIRGART